MVLCTNKWCSPKTGGFSIPSKQPLGWAITIDRPHMAGLPAGSAVQQLSAGFTEVADPFCRAVFDPAAHGIGDDEGLPLGAQRHALIRSVAGMCCHQLGVSNAMTLSYQLTVLLGAHKKCQRHCGEGIPPEKGGNSNECPICVKSVNVEKTAFLKAECHWTTMHTDCYVNINL